MKKQRLPSGTRSTRKGNRKAPEEGIAGTLATLASIKATAPGARAALDLLAAWLEDESGYDEKAFPELKKLLDSEPGQTHRNRSSAAVGGSR
jgi:hypothetical protein